MTQTIIPVIMCGGAGTRLWPASRETMPKQFLPLLGARSTFQETIARVTAQGLFEKPIVITNNDFRFLVAEQLQEIGAEADIVLEPSRRDSGPAVAVAAALALQRAPHAIVLILAADHLVTKVGAFHDASRAALPVAQAGQIVTFGIIPTEAATGYGYLKPGQPLDGGPVHELDAFAEKPDAATAAAYIDKGYLWNSGNFLFRADVMMAEIERYAPEIASAANDAVAAATRDLDFTRLAKEPFERAPKIAIDYAVMERTEAAAVLAVDFGWSDVGGWEAVWAHSPRDAQGNALSGPVHTAGTSNTLVRSDPSILTTVVGLDDVIVIASKDAVLVAAKSAVDGIKSVVDTLRTDGRREATEHRQVFRPWGSYEGVDWGTRHQVKRIIVKPGGQLSLQKHHHRSEHWIVVRGTGAVTIDGAITTLHENESIYIPIGAVHRLANPGKIPLELIEVQVGSYLGEDDIIRLEDVYNRGE